jgi:hypothetical protein
MSAAKQEDALDLVWGADEIARFINSSRRKTYHMLENRQIPARKTGGIWVASKRKLRAHFEAAYDDAE